jgi:hypothetical protein
VQCVYSAIKLHVSEDSLHIQGSVLSVSQPDPLTDPEILFLNHPLSELFANMVCIPMLFWSLPLLMVSSTDVDRHWL